LNDRYLKNTQISNLIKIHPLGAESFHADGWMDGRTDRQTDMMKLIAAFHKFCITRIKRKRKGTVLGNMEEIIVSGNCIALLLVVAEATYIYLVLPLCCHHKPHYLA
jgi:hypothetical protein